MNQRGTVLIWLVVLAILAGGAVFYLYPIQRLSLKFYPKPSPAPSPRTPQLYQENVSYPAYAFDESDYPTSTPGADGWTVVSTKYFSFKYPSSWSSDSPYLLVFARLKDSDSYKATEPPWLYPGQVRLEVSLPNSSNSRPYALAYSEEQIATTSSQVWIDRIKSFIQAGEEPPSYEVLTINNKKVMKELLIHPAYNNVPKAITQTFYVYNPKSPRDQTIAIILSYLFDDPKRPELESDINKIIQSFTFNF